jgi:hypothetical protein
MFNIELKDGQIFEVNGNTSTTYIYTFGVITKISPQEYNIIHRMDISKRSQALSDFRIKNDFI